MHAPKALPYMTTECSKLGLTQQECRAETWKGLSELRQEGIVRNVGVSNFAVKHLEEIEALNLAPIAANQIQYNPWAPDHAVETFEYCQKHNIAVTAYSSLAGLFQYSKAETVETLHDLAAKHNKSVAQIMLRWALQINAAVIPGTGNPEHMRENLDVYSFSLSTEDMSAIDKLRTDESAKKFFYMAPID
jgi:diketogulonate reductase-like aldo/keto reductase